jgi:hypothetical protein
MLMAVALAACGDNNTTSASATAGMTSTTLEPTTMQPTTVEPTTMQPTTSTTSGDSGTASDSGGMTTSTTGSTGGTSTTGTTGQVTATGTTGETTVGSTSTTSTTTGDTTTGGGCVPGETEGMGDVEKSYLWVANSDEGTVSKIDTQKVLEVGRYRTGPLVAEYAENPSRTAVSFDGRFVIVNGRQSGRSTVIAANAEDCVDKNANGVIETSKNKADILAWGADECVVWSMVHPFNGDIGGGPRGVTWTPGTLNPNTCLFEEPKVWVGYLPPQNGNAAMARLDGATGMVEETLTINNWFVGDTSWGPYGAALDKELNVWFIGLRGELFRINTMDNPATFDRWVPPNQLQMYGMTVDPDGDPWFGPNCGEITTFDPVNEQFIGVPGTDACHRGLAADKAGAVWVADNSQCGVWQVDHKMNKLIAFHPLNPCSVPVGVSTDTEGFVWVVDEGDFVNGGWAWKIDPKNVPAMVKVDVVGDHYTYSDMTGGQIKSVVQPM